MKINGKTLVLPLVHAVWSPLNSATVHSPAFLRSCIGVPVCDLAGAIGDVP